MPARTRLRTAVRRRSCGMRPGDPAFSHAFLHAFVKRVIRLPLTFLPVRWNTGGRARLPPSSGRAGLEVDVPPLEGEHLAWNAPAGDVRELHGWPDCRRQQIEHAFELLAFEEAVRTFRSLSVG